MTQQISRSVIASPDLPTLHRVPVTTKHMFEYVECICHAAALCSCARFDAATYRSCRNGHKILAGASSDTDAEPGRVPVVDVALGLWSIPKRQTLLEQIYHHFNRVFRGK